MKNHLRMFGLALCMLPMYLHAGTGEDLKQSYQPAELIPAGTILPVSLNSTLRSDKSGSGAAITATVMQDVPLGMGKTLYAGSKVTGHVVDAITPGKGSDESRISFQFDQVRFENRIVQISTELRALASVMEVDAAQIPNAGGAEDYSGNWNLVQIGGDQASYGEGGPIMLGSQVSGEYTSEGALANPSPDLNAACRGSVNGGGTGQALWLFSANACGTYGFGDVKISQSGRTAPVGEVTLISNHKAVKVGRGSAMLLRVDGSGSEEARGRATSSREAAQ
jgi:hypothetical protein